MAEKRKVNLVIADWERNFDEGSFKFRRLNEWNPQINVVGEQDDLPEEVAYWQDGRGWQDWHGWQDWQGENNGRQDWQDGGNGQHDVQVNMEQDVEMGETDDQH